MRIDTGLIVLCLLAGRVTHGAFLIRPIGGQLRQFPVVGLEPLKGPFLRHGEPTRLQVALFLLIGDHLVFEELLTDDEGRLSH